MCTINLQRRKYETIMPTMMTNDSRNEEHHLRMLPFDLLSLESDENGIPNLQPRMSCEMYENDDVGAAHAMMMMEQELVAGVLSHGQLPGAEYTKFLPRLACETNGAFIPMRVSPTMNPFHQQDMFCESSCRQHQSRESGWMASLSEASQGNDLVARVPQTPQVMRQVLERMPSLPPCRYSKETPDCEPRLMSPPCAHILFPDF